MRLTTFGGLLIFAVAPAILLLNAFRAKDPPPLTLVKGARIAMIGNNLGSRMIHYDNLETELQVRFPTYQLFIRNMCDPGETPGFRPHAGRTTPWAFPGAEKFSVERANLIRSKTDPAKLMLDENDPAEGFFETPDEWLTRLKTDVIIAFFGYNESFAGEAGLPNFKAELGAFIKWTLQQKYNGTSAPQLVVVSPIAFENLSDTRDLPDGRKENRNLQLYANAMKEVAAQHKVLFVDAFNPSMKWYNESAAPLTIDGSQLNEAGYRKLSVLLADQIFGEGMTQAQTDRKLVNDAVLEKNWMWLYDYKVPNSVHVYGRRYKPYGPDNFPAEIRKVRELTDIRDTAIWLAASKGEIMDLAAADKNTTVLPDIQTNYTENRKNGNLKYLYGQEAEHSLKLPPGYKAELFASESEFSYLAKPVQLSFDNKGRLWVATMPTYPQYRPGDPKPNDKIIILEDTDQDGKADKQTVFAEGLHLPLGFEIAPEGVYVSQGIDLVLLKDTDGDGKADQKEILLSGFDDHDSHHSNHAFTADGSGAIFSGEGVFLRSNIETSYGPVYATNGGFYRFDPRRMKLERTAQLDIPNPWGITFDDWGQPFFAETSSPDVRWMLPGMVMPRYGRATHKSEQLVEPKHLVRPTSGIEFVSSRHFPDDVQGDLLINNTIGFLGIKQHTMEDAGTGYKSHFHMDLLRSDDPNFRPVDLEFAPDGSLYVVDWHNVLIGHMQHNARDPLRDHTHGRIYRVTYPARSLVKPANIAGAGIDELLENLKLPEYRTRYRTRRELRGRDAKEVMAKVKTWAAQLDTADARREHHLLEALWVSQGTGKADPQLLKQVLKAKDYHVRAAAVQVLRYAGPEVPDQAAQLLVAARDKNSRVRLSAIVAASWMKKETGLQVLAAAGKYPMDKWTVHAYKTALAHLKGVDVEKETEPETKKKTTLQGPELALFNQGKLIYNKEGYCKTCHQADGKGLLAAGFPPLSGNAWVNGNDERLIKLVLKGLVGPIEVNGKKYPGQVPMTPFGGLLNDEEVAAVLTYVRNSFGNNGAAISPEKVKKIRKATENKKDLYSTDQLLKEHPMK
ncbi:PVC-type heme-binding CxxCH protein [Chitinophaga sp. NPDC101104]|uniref:PVC-type heme-binding CxxCH protein n=1 Tax=Chitinophaga sp. NPDC101104 TaxID=3390561 RepID=UPI003D067CF5